MVGDALLARWAASHAVAVPQRMEERAPEVEVAKTVACML
jgi:hypothetical protein